MRTWLVAIAVVLGCSERKTAEQRPVEPPRPVVTAAAESGQIVEVRDRITGETVPLDTIPQELLELSAESSRQQARGMDGASTTLVRAWPYKGPSQITPLAGAKLVAIEMTLAIPGTRMDPDDLDIIDADTGENYGSDPQLQRLTDAGEPAAWSDPVFTDDHRFRLVAIWAVPVATKRLQVGYWGGIIGGPIDLAGTGPALPEEVEDVVAIGSAGMAPDGSRQRFLVLVECFCARNAPSPWFQVVTSSGDLAKTAREVEVDAARAPIAPAKDRPFYLRRWWVVEQWGAPGAVEINRYGERSPLPGRGFSPSKALLAALAAAPLDPLARE